jgi:aminobenzoyl-glutamate utilization protein B
MTSKDQDTVSSTSTKPMPCREAPAQPFRTDITVIQQDHTSTPHIREIDGLVEKHKDVYLSLSDRLWDRPELRWEEHEAVAAQIACAEQAGFRIIRDVAGIPTAFIAEAGTGGPVVAILGEFDGLAELSQEAGATTPRPDPSNESGVGHGCGHHLLGAGSLLAAVSLKDYLAAHGLVGTVRYYGCPAEEAGAGKTFLVAGGAFDDVDVAVSWHPYDVTGVRRNAALAYCQVHFRFTGVAAHASVVPHLGRSALDAMELMNVGVNFLREHMTPECRIHYAILDAGGTSPNVVQASAASYYLIRAADVSSMRALYERVVQIAQGAALMTGTQVSVEFDGGCADLLPNNVLDAEMHRIIEELGPVPYDDADRQSAAAFAATISSGALAAARERAHLDPTLPAYVHEGVLPFVPWNQTGSGSTDVGDVSWVVPTVQARGATYAIGTPGHSWQLTAQGKMPAAHKGMVHVAKVMAGTAVDAIQDEVLLARAKADHQARVGRTPYVCPLPDDIDPPIQMSA